MEIRYEKQLRQAEGNMGRKSGGKSKEEENMRFFIRRYVEDHFGKIPVEIELETEFGNVDLVWECRHQRDFCVHLVEIKTPREMRSKASYKNAVKQLILYSTAIIYTDRFKNRRYYKSYVAVEKSKYGGRFAPVREIKELLRKYKIGLLVVDTKTGQVEEKIKAPVLPHPILKEKLKRVRRKRRKHKRDIRC